MQRWLLDYIERAFADVRLQDGMTIYEGESMDRYGDAVEDSKAVTAERDDWRNVPVEDLCERSCGLSFLDVNGFRFYTPAIMSVIIREQDVKRLLTDSFVWQLHDIRKSCRVRDELYREIYSSAQRAAIIRFIKFLMQNSRGGYVDHALAKTLDGLKTRSRKPSPGHV